ncbi:MAG: DUF3990 domain-containing protein [Bifidobacteriaceae bacterium]|jgi:hypothetical protein|nr:DUF3990 domain-containing protein [Bifidobacteriaceae bacterium]
MAMRTATTDLEPVLCAIIATLGDSFRLFHGSNAPVEAPRILVPARALDFGHGFYLTSDRRQAERLALLKARRLRRGRPVVSAFVFDAEAAATRLATVAFDGPTLEWLDFVVANRRGVPLGEHHDLAIGPVANDTTLAVIDDYIDARYTAAEAIARLLPQRLADQFAFLTRVALDHLTFERSEKF